MKCAQVARGPSPPPRAIGVSLALDELLARVKVIDSSRAQCLGFRGFGVSLSAGPAVHELLSRSKARFLGGVLEGIGVGDLV